MKYSSDFDYARENSAELEKYAGKWVVIFNNKVMFSDKKLSIAHNKFKKIYPDETPFVMYVMDEPYMAF